jgi:hypothetical protein
MMDEARESLPWAWEGENEKWLGKPTRFSCLAVKSETLLMAASPQWTGNKEYSYFVNHDGSPLVDTNYKQQKWEAAAAAALDVIRAAEENPQYNVRLYRNDEQNNGSVFNPYISVRDAQLAPWNCETLWVRTFDCYLDWEHSVTPLPEGLGQTAPTQRMVDAFLMIDGKTIEDSPLYSETGFATIPHPNWPADDIDKMETGEIWGHRAGEHNMFANREARFYAAILYNGRPVPQAHDGNRNKFSSPANADGWGRAELYRRGEGVSSPPIFGGELGSITGYHVLKNVRPGSMLNDNTRRPHIFIRLATIYLNYIEALNEYDPGHPDIEKYWNLVRSRAGVPDIFDSYPSIAGKRDKQLELILRERQVELCFENDRYFTTRRRWIAHLTDTREESRRMFGDGSPKYGLDVRYGMGLTDNTFYERTRVERPTFEKQQYIHPIPQVEINKSSRLVQNPWW